MEYMGPPTRVRGAITSGYPSHALKSMRRYAASSGQIRHEPISVAGVAPFTSSILRSVIAMSPRAVAAAFPIRALVKFRAADARRLKVARTSAVLDNFTSPHLTPKRSDQSWGPTTGSSVAENCQWTISSLSVSRATASAITLISDLRSRISRRQSGISRCQP